MSTPTDTLFERKGHWLTGSLRAFREDRLGFLAESARAAPIVKSRLGHRHVYLMSHPELIRDMLVTRRRHLTGEALRLYPAADLLMGAAAEPLDIGGHRIPANSLLMTSPYAMHRHPGLPEEPERFDRERFVENAERRWHTFRYLPLGGGPQIGIGNQFALVEGPLIRV